AHPWPTCANGGAVELRALQQARASHAGTSDYYACGLDQNLEIQPQRPVVDVLKVETDPVVEIRNLIAPTDLPQTGHARFYAEFAAMPDFETFELVRPGRARSHQAHVSLKDAPQLRQFVEAVFAQNASDASDSGIVTHLERRALHLVE